MRSLSRSKGEKLQEWKGKRAINQRINGQLSNSVLTFLNIIFLLLFSVVVVYIYIFKFLNFK